MVSGSGVDMRTRLGNIYREDPGTVPASADGRGFALPDETGALPTDEVFIAPLAKLLAEGAGDDSLVASDDPRETATVLFNLAGWGYVQLRHSQRWPAERARRGMLALVFGGLLPASS